MSLVLTSPACVGATSIGPRRTGIGCPLGPSLCGAANIVVLGNVVPGAGVVGAPALVLKVGIGLSGVVIGVVTVDGVGVVTAELDGALVFDGAGDAGAPKTDGVAVGVLNLGAWDDGVTAAGAGETTAACAGGTSAAGAGWPTVAGIGGVTAAGAGVNGVTAGAGTAT